LIILQEIKHSRQCLFSQIFVSKLIFIPITIGAVFVFRLQKGFASSTTIRDIIIKEDEFGYPTDIYRSCMLKEDDHVPIYSFCLVLFILLVLAYSVNVLHTISLQSTNDASSLSQIEELSIQVEETNDNVDERRIHMNRCLNESRLIFHFILATVCLFVVYVVWYFSTRISVAYNDISICVLQTYLSSANLVIIVYPYYTASRKNVPL